MPRRCHTGERTVARTPRRAGTAHDDRESSGPHQAGQDSCLESTNGLPTRHLLMGWTIPADKRAVLFASISQRRQAQPTTVDPGSRPAAVQLLLFHLDYAVRPPAPLRFSPMLVDLMSNPHVHSQRQSSMHEPFLSTCYPCLLLRPALFFFFCSDKLLQNLSSSPVPLDAYESSHVTLLDHGFLCSSRLSNPMFRS